MGCVRTNSPVWFGKNNSTGGTGGADGTGGANGVVDLPTHPNSIAATPADGAVTIKLGYSNTDFLDKVQVNWKLGDYPESPTDGKSVIVEGAATEIPIKELENELEYYFRVFLIREVDGVTYYQTDITNARITTIPRAIMITGITPLKTGTNYMVFTTSGEGTISAPAGTKFILGSGGNGRSGGFVAQHILEKGLSEAPFTLTVASGRTSKGTKVVVDGTTYDCGSVEQIISSNWGPIGGTGGAGGIEYNDTDYGANPARFPDSGTGSGGGGGAALRAGSGTAGVDGGAGGNYANRATQNYGGNGGNNTTGATGRGSNGSAGASGSGGSAQYQGSGGGGGGYASGGGEGGTYYYSEDIGGGSANGKNGTAGTGIWVIQW